MTKRHHGRWLTQAYSEFFVNTIYLKTQNVYMSVQDIEARASIGFLH